MKVPFVTMVSEQSDEYALGDHGLDTGVTASAAAPDCDDSARSGCHCQASGEHDRSELRDAWQSTDAGGDCSCTSGPDDRPVDPAGTPSQASALLCDDLYWCKSQASQALASAKLFRAVMRQDLQDIESLLSHGAQLNVVNGAGLTPLELAAERGKREASEWLLSQGPAFLKAQVCSCSALFL